MAKNGSERLKPIDLGEDHSFSNIMDYQQGHNGDVIDSEASLETQGDFIEWTIFCVS